MKLTTAGESHGKALIGIIEGLPAKLKIDIEEINNYLALRASGYGRGARQKIERDRVEILSGVRNLKTFASPLTFIIKNKDYDNWREYMAPEGCDETQRKVTKVRPGHADLACSKKYSQTDARNVLERASARETAVRVAGGTIFRQYLKCLNIEVGGFVRSVCGVEDRGEHKFEELAFAKSQPLFMLDTAVQSKAQKVIDELSAEGDTAGGVIEIRVKGLKSGFGSCMTYSSKLDAQLAFACMSVQAIKGVEIGAGFSSAALSGSRVHDEIFSEHGKFVRRTNNAGGIEGGTSNGEEIVIRAAMKPIPTLMRGLRTVDFITGEEGKAAAERSDVCAICAAEIVLESVVCEVIANAVSARLGGDSMEEVINRYNLLD